MSRSIALRALRFYAGHGAYPHERALGQEFLVDVELWYDFREAASRDDIGCAVDYRAVYAAVRAIVGGDPVRLLETLAERTAQQLLRQFPGLDQVRVVVCKPAAPLGGSNGGVEASAVLRRDG